MSWAQAEEAGVKVTDAAGGAEGHRRGTLMAKSIGGYNIKSILDQKQRKQLLSLTTLTVQRRKTDLDSMFQET